MAITTKLSGVEQLIRKLQRLGGDVEDLRATYGDIAAQAAVIARRLAPLGETGRLRASIRSRSEAQYGTVTASVVYAGPINYGWPKRNITPSLFMQRADAEIRPTVDTQLAAAIELLIARRGLAA